MKNYSNYSVEDLVQDHRFRTWVRRPAKEEDLFWEQWLATNPHMRPTLDEARAIVLSIHPLATESISDGEIDDEIKDIFAKIEEEEPVQSGSRQWRWMKVAASVALLSLFGVYAWYLSRQPDEVAVQTRGYMIEQVNKSGKPLLVSLPDNSSVLLSENCLIRYPAEFTGDKRNVWLSGTAFFEVTKDSARPFVVDAGQVIAKVLGTSFEINTTGESQTRIIVKSGSVSVYTKVPADENSKQPDIILGKDDQLIVREGTSELQRTRLNDDSLTHLSIPDTHLEFSNTPVDEVFARLSSAYGVPIDHTDASIRNCSVTASFTDEPFNLKLDLICRTIGVEYKMNSDTVRIQGKGCKTN